jgi:hypothetical protein
LYPLGVCVVKSCQFLLVSEASWPGWLSEDRKPCTKAW